MPQNNNEEFDAFGPSDDDFPEAESDDFDDEDSEDEDEDEETVRRPRKTVDDDDSPWQSVSASRKTEEPEPGSGPPNVRHARFGDGWVVARRDDKIDVLFADGTKRTLLKRFVTDL